MIVRSRANTILSSLFPHSDKEGYTYIGLGLSESTPDVNGNSFSEPSAGESTGYKRVKVTQMNSPSEGQIVNGDIIFFPESLGSGWGTIKYFGLFNVASGGKPYFWGELSSAIQVPAGYIPIFRANALKIGLDKEVLT